MNEKGKKVVLPDAAGEDEAREDTELVDNDRKEAKNEESTNDSGDGDDDDDGFGLPKPRLKW